MIRSDFYRYFLRPNFALTSIQSFRLATASAVQTSTINRADINRFNLRELKGPALTNPLPAPGKTFMIYTAIEVLNHLNNIPHGFINHTYWEPQSLPLVSQDRELWDSHQLVPWTGSEPVWVELVINNIDANGHPFHLVSLLFLYHFQRHFQLIWYVLTAWLRFLRCRFV